MTQRHRPEIDERARRSDDGEDLAMTTRLRDDQTATDAAPQEAAEEPTTIDFRDPAFLETAYDTYAKLRAEGPVSRVHIARDEPVDEQERRRQQLFPQDVHLVTHYDE